MKKLSFLFALLLLPLAASADDAVEIDGIYYNLITKAKQAEVTSNPNKYSGEIVIPETVKYGGVTYNVTAIAESAFSQSDVVSVVVSNSVLSIGDRAFSGSTQLSNVIIGNAVTHIGKRVFNTCRKLESITIGKSVVFIGPQAFLECKNLTKIHIADLEAYCKITFEGGNPFLVTGSDSGKSKHLYLNGEEIKDLVIPSSITSINPDAFYGCNNLSSVTIPNSITSIGSSAFELCSSITSFIIPNSVKSIGGCAFRWCTGLTNITIPNSVTSIESGVFQGCSSLISVTIPNSITLIDNDSFRGCTSLVTVNIPNSVTYIGSQTFDGCTGLTSVIIGSGVKKIGDNSNGNSFRSCQGLSDVYCLAAMVPSTYSNTFENSYTEYATLHVPEPALENYKATEPWSKFGTIVALKDGEPGNLSQDAVTLTAKSYTRQYGEANPTFDYTVTDGTITSGQPSITCSATKTSPVGTYPIVISKGSVTNSTVNLVNGMLTITKAPLTVNAGNYTKQEGEANPTFTPTFSGFKNNETKSVLTKQPTVTTTATASSPAGTYLVTVSGAEAQNYSISYVNGTLTVTPKTVVGDNITFADAEVKRICVENWDTNGDGELSKAEAAAVTDIGTVFKENKIIKTFNELQYFTGLKSIVYSAFYKCSGLTSVTIPNSVTSIGQDAFSGCSGLTTPNSKNTQREKSFV